jgi:hypothetical protein
MVRKLPGAALLAPQFVRHREDKMVGNQDVHLEQAAVLVDVPLADCDARQCSLPQSELLRRAAWTKTLEGKAAVRKLVLWQTNKAVPLVVGAGPDWAAYVLHVTDYSSDRQDPLQRHIRVSNWRQLITCRPNQQQWLGHR